MSDEKSKEVFARVAVTLRRLNRATGRARVEMKRAEREDEDIRERRCDVEALAERSLIWQALADLDERVRAIEERMR